MAREIVLTNEDGDAIRVSVLPNVVPTSGAPFHPSATHIDALGMPVAFFVADRIVDGRQVASEWPFHPTPCCGASASISDGPMYCKACYEEVDFAYGNHPVEPYRPLHSGKVES